MQNRILPIGLALGLVLSCVALAGTASASCVGVAAQDPQTGVKRCVGVKVDGNDIRCIGHFQSGNAEPTMECTGIDPRR